MASRRTYWMGAFPNRFETVVAPDDVNFFAAPEERPKPATAFVRIERLGLKGVARRARGQMKRVMASAPRESWRAPDPNYVGFIWEDRNRKDPIGFVAFRVERGNDETIGRRTKAPLALTSLDLQLMFVRPDRRRLGYGTCGACGVAMWLDACRVTVPRCPPQGTSLIYSADFYSLGGEACSNIILSQLRFYEEQRRDPHRLSLPWLIRDIMDESGI